MNSFKIATKYLSKYIGFVVLSVLTILSGVVIWKYIWPKYQEIQAIRAEIVTLTTKQSKLTTYVAYLKELEMTTLPLEEALVNYALPSENDVISLIVTYEGLSKTPDIEVSPFDFAPGLIQKTKTDKNGVTSVETTASADGSELATTQSRELEFQMEAKIEKPEVALDFINKIHQTRRLFSIKSLTWKNPIKGSSDENSKKINLTLNLGTYYYPSIPQVSGSEELVNKGREQGDLIAKLTNTTVFDALILESVEVGKEDFFTLVTGAKTQLAPVPNPTPIENPQASSSGQITQPQVVF